MVDPDKSLFTDPSFIKNQRDRHLNRSGQGGHEGLLFLLISCVLLVTAQIGMLMFLMNWAVVSSSSVDPHSLSFKLAPGGRMRILSGAWVGKFRKMCSGSWTPVPQGQLFV